MFEWKYHVDHEQVLGVLVHAVTGRFFGNRLRQMRLFGIHSAVIWRSSRYLGHAWWSSAAIRKVMMYDKKRGCLIQRRSTRYVSGSNRYLIYLIDLISSSSNL